MNVVKPGDRILVTGPSGYLGAHVLDQLLAKGYRVRGTLRSQRKVDQMRRKYPNVGEKLELFVVEDMQVDGAFDDLLNDVHGICHVASPFHFKPKDNERDLLLPAIKGTTSILTSALKATSLKRIVITSTMATISHIGKGVWPGKVYNVHPFSFTFDCQEDDYNPATWEECIGNPDAHFVYTAGKTFAERETWKFHDQHKPKWDIITIHPALIIGPFLHHVDKFSELNESVRQSYDNLFRPGEEIPPTQVQFWTDVRDTAKAHVVALEDPQCKGRYLIVSPDKFTWKKAFDAIRDRFPDEHIPKGTGTYTVRETATVDVRKAERDMGFGWTTLEESFGDMAEQFYRLKREGFPA